MPAHPLISYHTLHLHRSLSGPIHYTVKEFAVKQSEKIKVKKKKIREIKKRIGTEETAFPTKAKSSDYIFE